jgi:regulation of enolase protein 1 (concanavalin A-like superfamily)
MPGGVGAMGGSAGGAAGTGGGGAAGTRGGGAAGTGGGAAGTGSGAAGTGSGAAGTGGGAAGWGAGNADAGRGGAVGAAGVSAVGGRVVDPAGDRRRRLRILVAAAAVLVIAVAVPLTLRLLPIGGGKGTPAAGSQTSVAAAACGFTDNFDGTALDPAWERNRMDTRITVAGGYADVDAPDGTDIYHANMSAPMLLRPVTGDFVLETEFEATPKIFYQAAGLLLWNSQVSYVRMERGFGGGSGTMALEYNDGGKHSRVHGPLPSQDPVKTSATRVVMRLTRTGEKIVATWRPADKTEWSNLGTVTMHFPDTVRVGLSALNRAQFGAKITPFHARFDRVSVSC